MPEEKEERRCDLCEFENELPCSDKFCNSYNNLQAFEPKGVDSPKTGCSTCQNWKAVKIGKFCPDCGQALIN
jgi:hypothetical protein